MHNLTESETFLFSEGLNFFPTSNTVDKTKLKMVLEALGRALRLKSHFRIGKRFWPGKYDGKIYFQSKQKRSSSGDMHE